MEEEEKKSSGSCACMCCHWPMRWKGQLCVCMYLRIMLCFVKRPRSLTVTVHNVQNSHFQPEEDVAENETLSSYSTQCSEFPFFSQRKVLQKMKHCSLTVYNTQNPHFQPEAGLIENKTLSSM